MRTVPKYRIHFDANVCITDIAYDIARHGTPTNDVADEIRRVWNVSFAPGGVNALPNEPTAHIYRVRVYRNVARRIRPTACADSRKETSED